MYGYGLEGYGYRYPRRRREVTVSTFYPPEVQPNLIRTAVFNRAIAKKNDWIQHLHDSGFYDNVRDLLQQAKATYKPKDPAKRAKVLSRELTRLQAELNVLQKGKAARSLAPEYAQTLGKKYTDLTYDTVLDEKIARLQNEIAPIQQSLPQ
jgi:uncharacterized small protein (DUF1192 family)